MVAININGNQTLIPLSMFTKLLQQKYSSTQPTTTVRFCFSEKVFFSIILFILLSLQPQQILLNHKLYKMVHLKIVNNMYI